ncbi:MAG: glycosyltransferase [Bacteroidetes bacterium]|nr:glycosyltransferase [Bacteroidota bacterium]
MKKVSIITINLNNAEGLERTIKSVAAQVTGDFEFIIVDGASSDNSANVIEKWLNVITSYVSEKDSGIYEAMNKGIKMSCGEYLLFLNSGDYLAGAHVLESVIPLLDTEDVIGGKIIKLVDGKEHIIDSPPAITIDWFLDVSLHHQATFVRRSLFEAHGYYNETYRLGGDYEFFVRTLLKERGTYKNIPKVVCYFPADGISNQQKWLKINSEEKERTWNMHFGKTVRETIEAYGALRSSREMKWGRRIMKRLSFLKK